MKIFTDRGVYVQMNDLGFLVNSDIPVPASIFTKVFSSNVIIDNRNRFDFVLFEDEDEIEFFKKQAWLINFDDVKNLSEQEIIDMGQKIIDDRNKIARKYNNLPDSKKTKHHEMVSICDELEYKMFSLRDILLILNGRLEIKLPAGIVIPDIGGKDIPASSRKRKK